MKFAHFTFLFAATLAWPLVGVAAESTSTAVKAPVKVANVIDAQALFSPYVGTWKGETKILSLEKKPLSTLSVEQHYSLAKSASGTMELIGDAKYCVRNKEGKEVSLSVKSRTGIKDGKIYSEMTQDNKVERFDGIVDEDGFIVFMPEGTKDAPTKISSSRVEKEKDETIIRLKGFEQFHVPAADGTKKTGALLLDGRLVKQVAK